MLALTAGLTITGLLAFAISARDLGLAMVTGVDAATPGAAVGGTPVRVGACKRTVGEAESVTGARSVVFPAGTIVWRRNTGRLGSTAAVFTFSGSAQRRQFSAVVEITADFRVAKRATRASIFDVQAHFGEKT